METLSQKENRRKVLLANFEAIRQEILSLSPHPERVQVVAVTKRHNATIFEDLWAVGQKIVGESYVQDGYNKIQHMGKQKAKKFQWHLIGHLQTNKVSRALQIFDLLHSVDSLRLLQKIARRAEQEERKVPLLIQVNVSGETTKKGVPPEEVPQLLREAKSLAAVEVQGLMTMAPFVPPEETRPIFRKLRELRDQLRDSYPELCHLSMGMSNDYRVALQEGATLLRLGRRIFEGI